jgi:SAM-dependent methyltransferase
MLHQLARFTSVAPLVREPGPGEVLDVGSGSRGVAGWLGPGWTVTAVDRSFGDEVALRGPFEAAPRTMEADARHLPFPDASFDVVLALDVLEHVPPAERPRVLGELVRVARRRVVVACPTGSAALDADRRLGAGLRRRGMPPPAWLAEHEENGFPEPGDLVRALGPHGRLRMLADENLRWHGWILTLESRRPGFHLSRAAARTITARLASGGPAGAVCRQLARAAQGPRRGPAYRTIAVLDL